jgi:hypothetical protein
MKGSGGGPLKGETNEIIKGKRENTVSQPDSRD